jgi:hypothetical protein
MSNDFTTLNLLMRGGAISVTFVPALDENQYAQLHALMNEIESLESLRETLQGLAHRWQRQLKIDPC